MEYAHCRKPMEACHSSIDFRLGESEAYHVLLYGSKCTSQPGKGLTRCTQYLTGLVTPGCFSTEVKDLAQ